MKPRAALVLFRLWAALLLATIGLQATEPVSAPLHRVAGSAFSPATAEVALVSARHSDAAVTHALPTPPLPDPVSRIAPPIRIAEACADRLYPPVRGPPPRVRSDRLPDLRGPPSA